MPIMQLKANYWWDVDTFLVTFREVKKGEYGSLKYYLYALLLKNSSILCLKNYFQNSHLDDWLNTLFNYF